MSRRVFNLSLPIVYPDGTMQVPFREFIRVVDEAVNNAAITSVWGSISGTLSNQSDLQNALDGKATAAQGLLADSALQPGDALPWGDVTGTPTTLSGYGITDAATAAQGLLADTAVQPGDNVSDLANDAGYLTAYAPPAVRNEAATTYTMVAGDANTVVRFTGASPAVTVPVEASVNYAVGTELHIRQAGTGTLALTTTGLTINGTLPTWAQHVEAVLRKVGADEWDVI